MPDPTKTNMVRAVGLTAAGLTVAAVVAVVGRRRRAFRPDPDWEPDPSLLEDVPTEDGH